MHVDPSMTTFVAIVFTILFSAFAFKLIKQPYVIAYILAGICIGPAGFALITDLDSISRLGEIGIILLLFFIGIEVSPKKLLSQWKISILGTCLQICTCVAVSCALGWFLDWSVGRMILIGFAIGLSSTAVVLKVLEDRGETNTERAAHTIGVLLVQDILLVPMLIIVELLGDKPLSKESLALQIVGAVLVVALFIILTLKKELHIPLNQKLRYDHELQVFVALALCFGFALISALLGLSSALGAFMAGMIVGAAKETDWVHHSLHSFRVVFVSLFFLSVGMLVNIPFIQKNFLPVAVTVTVVLVSKTFFNAIVFRLLGEKWKESIYGGSILAQIGEFSFLLLATGFSSGMIQEYGYQLGVSVICLSLLLSPFWIALTGKTLKIRKLSSGLTKD